LWVYSPAFFPAPLATVLLDIRKHRPEHHCLYFQIKINFIEMHKDFDNQFVLSASDFPREVKPNQQIGFQNRLRSQHP
jgi:hypothetical protein